MDNLQKDFEDWAFSWPLYLNIAKYEHMGHTWPYTYISRVTETSWNAWQAAHKLYMHDRK